MAKSLAELLPERSVARRRIYAYSIADSSHEGLLKVGQTTSQSAKDRVAQQLKTAAITNYRIELDVVAEKEDGSPISDFEVRSHLKARGFDNPFLEWMRCTVDDVLKAIAEIKSGKLFAGSHHETFEMRPEQHEAVRRTHEYFHSVWKEDIHRVPRFLWNAKMRFGKTFATYQLAKKLGVKRLLIVTFKPAVEDAWQIDLNSHRDFEGWQYLSKNSPNNDPSQARGNLPVVYFGSFQDLLGRDSSGAVKPKNSWIHKTPWDLVVFDEYHFGAWREGAAELFEGEDVKQAKREREIEFSKDIEAFEKQLDLLGDDESSFLPIKTKAFLYLSGTPFRALSSGEFIEEQIFNWTYSDEQRAKRDFSVDRPDIANPYGALPEMRLFTYQMPDELIAIASSGEFNEFDLNEFFAAKGDASNAEFLHKTEVQKWLDLIRGSYDLSKPEEYKQGSSKPPLPYSDVRLLPHLNHSIWLLPDVSACWAMFNLLRERQNTFWRDYIAIPVAGPRAGLGLKALPPVRKEIGSGHDSKTITLTCGKLTTGVTVPQWSSILMLRNLNSPESYFQAAFRTQSPWVIKNPNGDDPNAEEVLKPVCFVFDFAPTRALRQISEYASKLSPMSSNPEVAMEDLLAFLPVLAFDGYRMSQIDAGGILDIAIAGTSATLLARKWDSALLVNVDNETLKRILNNPQAHAAVLSIEGFRSLGDRAIETVINRAEKVKELKRKSKDQAKPDKKEITDAEREYRNARREIQEKLIKFATRIPAFMYLTDFRENTLRDVITKLEPGLFRKVTGITIEDFEVLVSLGVFSAAHMNQAVYAFRRYEDASLSYAGIESHSGLRKYGLYDTVVAKES